jgi:hypothetical protein
VLAFERLGDPRPLPPVETPIGSAGQMCAEAATVDPEADRDEAPPLRALILRRLHPIDRRSAHLVARGAP